MANKASFPIAAITRGHPPRFTPAPDMLPLGGIDNGDGTCSLMVSGSGGGGGGGSTTASSITVQQLSVTTVGQISAVFPAATRFLVKVLNTGGSVMYVGPSGVTASTGYPIFSGSSESFPLNSACTLDAISPNGTTCAVIEYAS